MLIPSEYHNNTNYELLRVYAYYRTALSSLLLLMFAGNWAPNLLGTHDPTLFLSVSLGYTCINIVTLVFLWQAQFEPRQEQLFTLLFVDILAIVLMMHASGSSASGLGYLLVICVAAGSTFLRSQLTILVAALASIAVLTQTLSSTPTSGSHSKELFSAGALGALLFTSAMGFQYLSNKIRSSNLEAQSQAQQAAHSQQLAQVIVERMRTGIIASNQQGELELINQAAIQLLALNESELPKYISQLPNLEESLQLWQRFPHNPTPILQTSDANTEIKISFAKLDPNQTDSLATDTVIFIVDNRALQQQAQQLKLASLGRLAANIAHEIRNPLGAISHASQLLGEASQLGQADQKLLDIIHRHSQRVNHIIENVLQLSRRQHANLQLITLNTWLPQFRQDYINGSNKEATIEIHLDSPRLEINFDPSQLQQVLTNLVDNGLRHGYDNIQCYQIKLLAAQENNAAYIDVIDEGQGIDDCRLNDIFEPFITTEETGSGLGLYICKELCEANHATLNYRKNRDNKSCFRIQLAHNQRILS